MSKIAKSSHNSVSNYLILMLLAIAVRTYFFETIAIVWIINFLGVCWFFRTTFLHPNKKILWACIVYVLCAVGTIAFNTESLGWGLKAVGTNLNTLAVVLFWLICGSRENEIWSTERNLNNLFHFLSLLGFISVLYAWLVDFSSVFSIIRGASAYSIKSYGFFYGKNIYGAFVALTIGADLWLYQQNHSWKHLFIMLIKIIAIVLSFSRAALLLAGGICSLSCLLGIRRKNTLKLSILLAILGALGGWFILSSEMSVHFFIDKIFRIEVGDAGRAALRETALAQFGSSSWHFLFGVGYFNMDFLDMDIDNTYLYLLFSGGLLKLIIYFLAYVLSLHKILWLRKRNLVLGNICLAISISYLAFAYFESVSLFELGLLNFIFGVWLYLIPFGYQITCEE